MLFQSIEFAIFFAIVFALYVVLPHNLQNRMLLIGSYIFYGAWDWRYLSLIIISTTVDYFCSLAIERNKVDRQRKQILAVSLITNIGLLGIFKYYDFFASNFQELMGTFGLEVHPYFLNVALPVGISFYTFQTMSYSIDVYRGKLKPAVNYFDFALYVAYFPQLIAGPIERGTRLLPQILEPRLITLEKIYHGAYFFGWGLFLKIFVADNLAKMVDPVFATTGSYDGAAVWLATIAFAFQIYADFAGYSFMAIGLAKTMGIDLMENFKRPYFSHNISEFWRRWHISLSSWFRDYFFSPMYLWAQKWKIVSRFNVRQRHAIAFFITLFTTEYLLGLWHGAGWNYGFFGIYHAFAIWGYYYSKNYWDKMPIIFQIFLTFIIACGGWLVFRAQTLGQAFEMFAAAFTNFSLGQLIALQDDIIKLFGLVGILLVVQIFQHKNNDTLIVLKAPAFVRYPFFVLLLVLVLVFGDFNERPFIYFQF